MRENLSRAARRQEWNTEYFAPVLVNAKSLVSRVVPACGGTRVPECYRTDRLTCFADFDAARIHDPVRPAAEAGRAASGRAVREGDLGTSDY